MEKVNLDHPDFTKLSTEILDKGNRLRFTAHGSSMAPFIGDGDVLTVEPVAQSQLSVGNIVFYLTEGDSLIAHRIVEIQGNHEESKIKVRGDASPGSEEVISPEKVLGSIESVDRKGKEFRINQGAWRTLGIIWVYLYPLPFIAYRMIKKIRSISSRPKSVQ